MSSDITKSSEKENSLFQKVKDALCATQYSKVPFLLKMYLHHAKQHYIEKLFICLLLC